MSKISFYLLTIAIRAHVNTTLKINVFQTIRWIKRLQLRWQRKCNTIDRESVAKSSIFVLERKSILRPGSILIALPTRIKNTKFGFNNCQIIDKIDKKFLFYLTIHQDQKINLSNQQGFFNDLDVLTSYQLTT